MLVKKTANQLEVWPGEVDTPGPPISVLYPTAILVRAIEQRWLSSSSSPPRLLASS